MTSGGESLSDEDGTGRDSVTNVACLVAHTEGVGKSASLDNWLVNGSDVGQEASGFNGKGGTGLGCHTTRGCVLGTRAVEPVNAEGLSEHEETAGICG